MTEEEKAKRFYAGQQWRQERIATGELIFSFDTHIAWGLSREWRDGEQPLEEQVGDIVAILAIGPSILEKRRLEAEELERRRWEAERKRQEAKEREDQDHNRWRRFIEFAHCISFSWLLFEARFVPRAPSDKKEQTNKDQAPAQVKRESGQAFGPTNAQRT